MVLMSTSGGGRFEKIGSYARAKRVGPFVFIAGTTAIEPSGKLHQPGDTYAQTLFIFKRIQDALESVGADMRHVVRTRAFLSDIKNGGGFIKAHGEIFAGIEPVTTGVEAGLTTPGMMVEIEVDAIIHDSEGQMSFS